MQRTQLDMTLRKRGEGAPLWRGSAVTVRSDARGDVAADLCNALLRAYPAQSDTILGVP